MNDSKTTWDALRSLPLTERSCENCQHFDGMKGNCWNRSPFCLVCKVESLHDISLTIGEEYAQSTTSVWEYNGK